MVSWHNLPEIQPRIVLMMQADVSLVTDDTLPPQVDNGIALPLFFCIMCFFVGLMVGWLLHQQQAKYFKSANSRKSKNRSRRTTVVNEGDTAAAGNVSETEQIVRQKTRRRMK